jgi:hypothetical protein
VCARSVCNALRLSTDHYFRYLEDFIQELDYRPSGGKQTVGSSKAQKASEDALKLQGLDDRSISAIQSITRSDRVDYQVR